MSKMGWFGVEIVPEPFLVLFQPGTTSVRSGRGTFLLRRQNMLSIFSVLSETSRRAVTLIARFSDLLCSLTLAYLRR